MTELLNLVKVGVLPTKILNGHLLRLSESLDLSLVHTVQAALESLRK